MRKLFLTFMLAAACTEAVVASELVPVLQEGFIKCTSEVIQGGYFAESNFFETEDADNPGWTTNYAYYSERALKFSAKTKPAGYAVTPALEFSAATAQTVVVRFRAQTWAHKDDKLNVCVQVEGDPSTMQSVDADASTNVADRSEEPFELTFTNVPTGSKFRFYPEKKEGAVQDRWFLSDVVILEECDAAAGPHIYTSAGYQRFADIMAGNDSEIRTIEVGAAGIGDDLSVELPENSSYSVEKTAWDARRGGTLSLRFDPMVAGNCEEQLTISAGNTVHTVLLRGFAKVYTPVAKPATNVQASSFTANWERVAGLESIVLTVYTKENGPLVASDLMFTKYIEGKSNNRAVEIFNGTGREISLDGYRLLMESNGAGGYTFGEYKFPADAKVADGGTFTLCNAQYGALRDIADATIGFSDGGYANIMTFTGNDAIGLFAPDGTLVDAVGYESTDVNDEVSGNWGQDKSFYRKSSSYEPSDKFRIDQWEEHPMDYCEGYGTHTMDATGLVKREIKRITLERGATSAIVEGIPENTPCYYTVQGLSGATKTLVSAEIAVNNAGSGITDITGDSADAPAEYYNLQGIRVHNPAHGEMYIVRQGAKAAKVVF